MGKRNIFIILIVLSLLTNINSNIYSQNTYEDQSLDKFKQLSNFSSWQGKKLPVRNGINLSNYNIRNLSDAEEVKKKIPFSIWETEDARILIKYRSRWKISQGNSISVTMTFANTCEDAHEYLIRRYYNSTKTFQSRIPKVDQPAVAGNISFDNGRKFIRNNIVVEIYAHGEMKNKVTSVSKEIDALLLERETASSIHSLKPIINRFVPEKRQVDCGSLTKLNVDVIDPQGSELLYFWRLTEGGIDEDERGDYYYHAGNAKGVQEKITLIVVNDRGYYSSVAVEMDIR